MCTCTYTYPWAYGGVNMATKSITIDLEAYERLVDARRDNESFSQVIKRTVPRPFDLDAYLRELEEHPMSDKAADAIEEHVRRRHEPSMRER